MRATGGARAEVQHPVRTRRADLVRDGVPAHRIDELRPREIRGPAQQRRPAFPCRRSLEARQCLRQRGRVERHVDGQRRPLEAQRRSAALPFPPLRRLASATDAKRARTASRSAGGPASTIRVRVLTSATDTDASQQRLQPLERDAFDRRHRRPPDRRRRHLQPLDRGAPQVPGEQRVVDHAALAPRRPAPPRATPGNALQSPPQSRLQARARRRRPPARATPGRAGTAGRRSRRRASRTPAARRRGPSPKRPHPCRAGRRRSPTRGRTPPLRPARRSRAQRRPPAPAAGPPTWRARPARRRPDLRRSRPRAPRWRPAAQRGSRQRPRLRLEMCKGWRSASCQDHLPNNGKALDNAHLSVIRSSPSEFVRVP